MAKQKVEQAATKVKTFNLAKEGSRTALRDYVDAYVGDFYGQNTMFGLLLKDSHQSPVKYNKTAVFTEDQYDGTILVANGRVYGRGQSPHNLSGQRFDIARETPGGVVVTNCPKRHKANKGWDALVILNADEEGANGVPADYASIVGYVGNWDMPTVSFECLARMLGTSSHEAAGLLATGKVVLLDYTTDDRIDLTAAELKTMNDSDPSKRVPVSPKLGYSLVGKAWHRSGFALFQNVKDDTCYISGQDEGTYFGCQLPSPAKTVEKALAVLTPKEVQGKPFKRQGEWFALEVDEAELPQLLDRAINIDGSCDRPYLPVESEDSNHHELDGEVVIGKDGAVYFSGYVYHDQHETLDLSGGWHRFYRNTAVRSVSVEGVD